MNSKYSIGGGTFIAVLLSATASFADVTPQDVWDNWRGQMERYGYEVTVNESKSGDRLRITDFSMTMPFPEDSGEITVTLGAFSFVGLGDGTVMVDLPATMPININIEPVNNGSVDLTITQRLTDLSMIASGTPDAMTYTYSASEMSIQLVKVMVEDVLLGPIKFELGLTDIAGISAIKTDALLAIRQKMTAALMTYDIGFMEGEGDLKGALSLKGSISDLKMSSDGALPFDVDMQNLNAALRAGLAGDITMTNGAGSSEFSFSDGVDTTSGSTSIESGSFVATLNNNRISYGWAAKGVMWSMLSSEIPLPLNLALAEAAFNLSMPTAKSDSPQDFSLLVKLIDLTPGDMIWNMFDPTGMLPRDPADLVIDIAGKANWLFDIFDPAQAENMAIEALGELHALTLKDLRLSAAGAVLTGIGNFTFNNDDLTTFDGVPAPDGTVELKLVGANSLIDKLIAMGMMTNDDAMGARMMMGLFGRPGDGEDTLLSTIEVKSTGEISANGMRLQ